MQGHQVPVAVIGMACRFPGANTPAALWELLCAGGNSIVEIPPDRWDVPSYFDADLEFDDTMNTRWGGFLADIDQFDPRFFGISTREAADMDPQQRLMLEVSWEALENAGLAPDQMEGSETGVFAGATFYDYQELLVGAPPRAGTGVLGSLVPNRLSYLLDLHGPSLMVDTACSSSLVAVHLACQSLGLQESDVALAAGVNAILSPRAMVMFSQANMMAKDGRCKTFDAAADGFVRAEGCGVVVLKRLADARRDGDNILAVLRGTAVNQDGRGTGLSTPNTVAQQAVIRRALGNAGRSPEQVDYVEAHGTGTPQGDMVEVESLSAVLGGGDRDTPCVIGSLKANIGHLESAAGIAGVIKAILVLQHGRIPAQPDLVRPNPKLPFQGLVVPTAGQPSMVRPNLICVNSFGFGGTNAHAVIEAGPQDEPEQSAVERPAHILTLSAKSGAALLQLAARYQSYVESEEAASLADICFTANCGRSHFEHRLAIVAESRETLKRQLAEFAGGERMPQKQASHSLRPVFLFAGQGGQYAGMGYRLYETQPVFRRALQRCDELLRDDLAQPLLSVLYPEPGKRSPIDDTEYSQPALFAFEYALAELWKSWGIVPGAVMGHSVGEYVAACVAGIFSLEDGLRLTAERARLMSALPGNGAMAAVFAGADVVLEAMAPHSLSVAIAAVNGPKQTVISGERDAVRAVVEALERDFYISNPLNVSHAFHSPLMEPMLDAFAEAAGRVSFEAPGITFISNVTGQEIKDAPAAAYWRDHVRQPVSFASGMKSLNQLGMTTFIEIGPGDTLIGMGKRCLPDGGLWLPSLRPGKDEWNTLLSSLAALYLGGARVDWAGFDRDYVRHKVPLPTYPFEHRRCWLEPHEARRFQREEA